MKKRNGLICILISSLCILMVGCGPNQSQHKNPSVAEITDNISQSIDISEMKLQDEEMLTMLYKINIDDIEEFVLYTAPTNIQADELAIIKVKEDSSVKEIKEHMAQRVEEQSNSFKDYLPEEYALIENHVLTSRNSYILLAISGNADKIEEIFNNSFK